ncbi:trehalose operon repressor [Carnobacteriaceae bacterium 52-44]
MTKSKYYDIYLQLKQKIMEGVYEETELLPSENAMAKEYSVSRETIRKALDYLSQDGLIQKKQGKGSIVLNPRLFNFPISGLTSFKELSDSQRMQAETFLISNERIKVDDSLQKQVMWPLDKEVIAIERIREIDGQKVIFDTDYLDPKITGEISNERLENSLYDYLENDLKLPIAFANKEILVENVTEKDRTYMDLRDEDNHLVVIRSAVYLEDARFFQFSESRHRVDRFRFVDFSRRQHTLDERDF